MSWFISRLGVRIPNDPDYRCLHGRHRAHVYRAPPVGNADWAARFRTGVAVRGNFRKGGTRRRLLQVDADQLHGFGFIQSMEGWPLGGSTEG